ETDIVFTTSPSFSNHFTGRFLQRNNRNIYWASELRDFHFVERYPSLGGVKAFINQKLESNVMKHSDKISFISYTMKDIYSNYYPQYKHKFETVYNGFDVSDFEKLNIEKTNNEKLTIFYAGSF